jgi:hypothetical protein
LSISRDWSRSEIKSCNPKNQIWDNPEIKWYLSQSGCGIKSGINTTFLARNCGSVSVAPELTMPPRRTGFNEYMPQGQRTLTEVDGVVEIGPVGPATQKEVAPAQANTSRKRDAELRQQHSQQQPVALLVTTLLLPKAVAAGSQLRQPHNRAAAAGSSGRLPTSIRRHRTSLCHRRLSIWCRPTWCRRRRRRALRPTLLMQKLTR